MIERVYIDNFRCFSGFELRLDRVNLLIGPNGSGKSSLVEVLAAIADSLGAGTSVDSWFVPEDLTRWDTRAEQRFELDVRLGGERFGYLLRLRHDIDDYDTTIIEEVVERDGEPLYAYRDGHVHLYRDDDVPGPTFPFGGYHSFLREVEARPEYSHLDRFLRYMRTVRALKLMPPQIESATHDEQRSVHRTGENFSSWYRHLAQERAGDLHELFAELRRALPGFRSLALVGARRSGRSRDLVARFDSPGGGEHELEFEALSDGQRALIVLYTLLLDLRGGPRLLLLDEPENFVGLTEIRPWLHALDDALAQGGAALASVAPSRGDRLVGCRAAAAVRARGWRAGPRAHRRLRARRGAARLRAAPAGARAVSARAAMRGVVLCEDKLTERFVRRLLGSLGFDTQRRIRFETAPSGSGSGEAWVRQRYPHEVRLLRSKRHQRDLCLLAIRDGDRFGVDVRKRELDEQLVTEQLEPRQVHERIATPVPTWSIETWLLALLGDVAVHEGQSVKVDLGKRHGERADEVIVAAVRAWNEGAAEASKLPSLRDASVELARISS